MKSFKYLLLFVLILSGAISSFSRADERKLTVLYTNDLHSHFEPHIVPWVSKTRKVGGFANIATLVKREKASNEHTVYFDAGDFFTGPYVSSLTKGEAVIDAMNHLGLDAVAAGNHEFDHGWKNTQYQFAKAKFPILNGNIFVKDTGKLVWNKPYIIKKVNGIRLGIIGLHGKFAFYDTTADEMIKGLDARDEEVYLRKYIKELEGKTDLIVLLIHQGIPGTQSSGGTGDVARNHKKDIELARNVPGIDLMVTGHPHSGTPKPLVSNGTIIVSTDAYTIELGKLELIYNKETDKITSHKNTFNYLFDDEVPDDPQMLKIIKKWKDKVKTITDEEVTTSSTALTRSYSEESLLGNLVADAMLDAFPGNDFAVTNSGGLRQDVDAGAVTVGELISAFPFPNTIVQLQMKGSDLREMFEHGAGLTNGILQASKGVEMSYDESKPIGKRVVKVEIKGVPLDDNKTYKVITSNFLADGGDGFVMFKKTLKYKNTQIEILDSMVKFLKKFNRYEPNIEGRVKKL
ncbi:MAG: bifunctional metallophosphatase/5'-nucleotidase [Pyrinomonadaceae bacterium]|nr:bifunctional metallophosphatase/5'-nucleotidase [Pyrinomonadaceae bacterium]